MKKIHLFFLNRFPGDFCRNFENAFAGRTESKTKKQKNQQQVQNGNSYRTKGLQHHVTINQTHAMVRWHLYFFLRMFFPIGDRQGKPARWSC